MFITDTQVYKFLDGDESVIEVIRTVYKTAYQAGVEAEREACAALCRSKAKQCADRAYAADDNDDIVSLKSIAWQLSVMSADIRARSNP